MNILYIDTSNNLVTKVGLKTTKGLFEVEEKRGEPGDQNVLELIQRLLKEQQVSIQDITGIEVATGPGSFTGLRVGTAIANTLSFSLGLPVNGKKTGEFVFPQYS